MSPTHRLRFLWLLVLLGAGAFLAWSDCLRLQRVEYVSGQAPDGLALDPASPTGYAGGKRWLIVPEHNNATYQWIEQTQDMAARHLWRVRRMPEENAPEGRDVGAASPYRWWLRLVAAADRLATHDSAGRAIERAALFADPALHLLFLLVTACLVARWFGPLAGATAAVAIATLYPLGAGYLPGVANEDGLAKICAAWSVLPLLAGVAAPARARRLFWWGGAVAGVGFWISAPDETPIAAGIAVGALLARWAGGAEAAPPGRVWRGWLAGLLAASAAGFLLEYFPSDLAMGLRTWRRVGAALFRDLSSPRLTNLPDGVVANSLHAWLARDGWSGPAVATLLGTLLLAPALWILLRPSSPRPRRVLVALALGPAVLAAGLAAVHLRWWGFLDAALLALAVAATAEGPAAPREARMRWLAGGCVAAAGLAGLIQLAPRTGAVRQDRFTPLEAEEFDERALAHWIADHASAPGACVLAPPFVTPSLCFYGGLRGLGTANWENRDGLLATWQIFGAQRPDEAEALAGKHGVAYIVLPSWDTDLEQFIRLNTPHPEGSFLYQLHAWTVFDWIRPLPCILPSLRGAGATSVHLFAVGPERPRAETVGAMTEYFLEMGRTDVAASALKTLRQYPTDTGALAAMAQTERASGDSAGYARVLRLLGAIVAAAPERPMAWDRRVSVATALALGGRDELARAQVRRCLQEIDAAKLRSLTPASLYHLLLLAGQYGLPIADGGLRALAIDLLPRDPVALRRIAQLAQANLDTADARRCYRRVAAIAALEARDHYYLADLAGSENDLDGAQAELRATIAAAPDYLPARIALGQTLYKSGRAEAAAEEFQQVLARAPGQPQATYEMARIELDRGDDAAAVRSLEALLQAHPEWTSGAALLAQVLDRRGETGRAEALRSWSRQRPEPIPADAWMDALWADCSDASRLEIRAEQYFNAGQIDRALALLDRVEALDPKSPVPLLVRGSSELRNGRMAEAAADCRQALARGGDPEKICPILTDALLSLGQGEEARALIADWHRKLPDSVPIATADADAILRGPGPGAAEGLLAALLEKQPYLYDEGMALVKILWGSGRRDQAVPYLRRLLELRPQDAAANGLLAQSDLERGQPQPAIARLEPLVQAAAGTDAERQQLQTLLGAAYLEQGRLAAGRGDAAGAVADYGQSLRWLPDRPETYAAEADALVTLKQFAAAAEALGRLGRLEPGNPTIELSWGDVLLQGGDAAGARAHWQRALQLAPAADGALRRALADRLGGRLTADSFK